jgi:hypothetical protein
MSSFNEVHKVKVFHDLERPLLDTVHHIRLHLQRQELLLPGPFYGLGHSIRTQRVASVIEVARPNQNLDAVLEDYGQFVQS